jgi:hypothetical protein
MRGLSSFWWEIEGWVMGGGTTLIEDLAVDVVPLRAHGFGSEERWNLMKSRGQGWRLLEGVILAGHLI